MSAPTLRLIGGPTALITYGGLRILTDPALDPPETAVQAAAALDPAPIVAIHQDGWAHFTSHAEDVIEAFAGAGISDRLRSVAPGQEIALG